MADRPLVEINGLSKMYGLLPVLKQVNLDVQHGQFVALLGPNGSGKSTLLRLICGLLAATDGTINVGGWHIPEEAEAVRAQIGFVSHQSLVYGNLTARENLRFYARLYNIPRNEMNARIDDLLALAGLTRRAESPVRTFSRGMQQRLSIARALLNDPALLLLDEPYTGLDADAAQRLDTILHNTQRDGKTIIMATHQLDRAAELCDRVIIVHRGRIAWDDITPTDSAALITQYATITGAAPA